MFFARFQIVRLGLFTLAVSVWATGAFAAPTQADWDQAAERLLTEHLRPRHATFAENAEYLHQAAQTFCAAPSQAGLPPLHAAYAGALDGWMGLQHITFGPIVEFNRKDRLQFWPDKRNTTPRHLAKLLNERAPENLKSGNFVFMSVAVQGFPALERLMFGKDAPILFAGNDDSAYRCRFLTAVARNIADLATELQVAWGENGDGQGGYGYYEDGEITPQEFISSLLSGINAQLLTIRDQKLLDTLGKSPDQAKPKKGESWRSARSMVNIVTNLDAVEEAMRLSVLPLVQAQDPQLASHLENAFATTGETARAVPMALSKAVLSATERPRVKTLALQLRALRQLAAEQTAQSLGLTLGFNSKDGD